MGEQKKKKKYKKGTGSRTTAHISMDSDVAELFRSRADGRGCGMGAVLEKYLEESWSFRSDFRQYKDDTYG